jgi:hypothetical protein
MRANVAPTCSSSGLGAEASSSMNVGVAFHVTEGLPLLKGFDQTETPANISCSEVFSKNMNRPPAAQRETPASAAFRKRCALPHKEDL